jgi:hypothetical protein
VTDLLVRLYDLPEKAGRALPADVAVRRALAPERDEVLAWVGETFQPRWASECALAFSGHPIATFIAVKAGRLVGFAAHDGIAKGFFGPTGVLEAERRQGIGEALLFTTLRGMREAGYAYAIIGWANVDFYKKYLDVIEIPNSDPGPYRGLLPRKDAAS